MQRFSLHNAQKAQTAAPTRLLWVFGGILMSFFILSFALMQFVGQTQAATPPSVITYQGKLLENGSSVTTSKAMAFLIYDAAAAGNLLYTASGTLVATTTINVTPTSGIFAVNLGDTGTNSIDPTIFANNTTLYLEVIVDGTTLSPRKRITAAPYATNAKYLLGYSPETASTSQYIPLSDTDGNLTFTGTPTSTAVSGGIVYINPAAATANFTLFGIAVNGNERFRIDEDGDTWIDGALTASTTLTVGTTTTIGGNAYVGNATEAITTSSFVMNGDDMYVHDLLGVGDSVYIEDSLYIGTSTLRLNGSNAGGVIAMTNGSLTIDSDTSLNINTTNNQNVIFGSGNVGINSTTPAYLFSVEGNGFFSGIVTTSRLVANTSITLGGVARTTWPSGGGSGAWSTTTNLIYPNNTSDVVVIGKVSTATISALLEVEGDAFFNGTVTATDWYATNSITLGGVARTTWPSGGGGGDDGDWVTTTNVIYPSSPTTTLVVIGSNATSTETDILQVSGGSYFQGGTSTFDGYVDAIGNANSPSHIVSMVSSTNTANQDIVVQGNYAYIVRDDVFYVYDVTEASAPSELGSVSNAAGVPLEDSVALAVSGDFAYVAANTSDALTVIDVSKPNSPQYAGSISNGGAVLLNGPSDVEVAGNYAYVAVNGSSAFTIIDISDPYNPTHVTSLADNTNGANLGFASGIFVEGNFAYITAFSDTTLQAFDISDPRNPDPRGTFTTGLIDPEHFYVSDGYAYVVDGFSAALRIVDVGNPDSLNEVTTVGISDTSKVFVSGDYAYVAMGDNNLRVIDVSDPANPNTITTIAHDAGAGILLQNPENMYVAGEYLYIETNNDAGTSDTLTIFHIGSGSLGNARAGELRTNKIQVTGGSYFGGGVHLAGGLSVGNSGLLLSGDFGMNLPTSTVNATNTLRFSHTTLFETGVTTTDDTAFVFNTTNNLQDSSGLFSIRDANTEYLSISGSGTTTLSEVVVTNGVTIGGVRRTSWPSGGGSGAWTTTTNLIYPNNTTDVVVIGKTSTSSATNMLEVEGNTFVNGSVGINSNTPQYHLAVSGTAYISLTSTFGGPAVFNSTTTINHFTSLPGKVINPSHLSSIANGDGGAPLNGPGQMFAYGSYLYVSAFDDDDLTILDISDPANISYVGSIAHNAGTGVLLDGPGSVFVQGDYAYVAANVSNALTVIDVSDPSNPVHVSSLSDGGAGEPYLTSVTQVFIVGNLAYVTSLGDNALQVIDISDPYNMKPIGSITDGGGSGPFFNQPYSLFVRDGYAYVVTYAFFGTSYLNVIDVDDPTNPTYVSSIADGGASAPFLSLATAVVATDHYIYISANGDDALEIIDISDPTNPTHAGFVQHNGSSILLDGPRTTYVAGNYAYTTAENSNTLTITDVSDPTNPTVVSTVQDGGVGVAPHLSGALGVVTRGNHVYVGSSADDDVEVIDVSGAEISNVDIGNAAISILHVESPAFFNDSLSVDSGLSVGNGGFLLGGDFAMTAVTSSWTAATNTLRFAHTALFQSQASTTDDLAFRFDTYNTLNNAGSLFSIRNNGTEYLSITGAGTTTVSEIVSSNGITLGGVRRTSWPSGGTDNDWTTSTNLLYPNSTTDVVVIGGTATTSATTIFEVNGTSYFSGAVGIVTTSELYTLSVSGTAYVSANTILGNELLVRGDTTIDGRSILKGRVLNPTFRTELDGDNVGGGRMLLADDVVVVGDYAYVVSEDPTDGGLDIIDVSNPNLASHVGSLSPRGGNDGPGSVYVAGDYVYAAPRANGVIEIIDASDQANPEYTGTVTIGLSTDDIFVSGNYLYAVSTDSNLFAVVDVSDPYNPALVSTSSVATSPRNTFVSGRYAYVTSDESSDTFTVLDVSNPVAPITMDAFTVPGMDEPGKFYVTGNNAYVTASGSLHILNISDKTAVSETASTSITGLIDIYVAGDYAYVLDNASSTIRIYDVSDPTFIEQVGTIVDGQDSVELSGAENITVAGNYLYATDRTDNSLQIIDVTGAMISNSEIGSARISTLEVDDYARLRNGLHVYNGMSVGSGGFILSGDFAINAPTSTLNATNTLAFSHTALFKSNASSSDSHAFIFDTAATWPSSTTKYLLSLRTGGTPAFSVATNGDVHTSGTLFAASATVGTPGTPGDLAERVDVAIDDTVGPGDVVVVDPNNPDTYRRSTSSYSERVAGIISTLPTIVIGDGATTNTAIMAMTGRVPVKVSTENGPIQRGDLLVTASTTGYAMRYDPAQDPGTRVVGILGMALDSFSGNASTTQGSVLSLIRTGWVYNQHQTISQMQTELANLAAAQGQPVSGGGTALNVSQLGGQITVNSAGHLDLGWREIQHVMAVRGQAWEIDTQGRFVTRVDAGEPSPTPLYAVQSQGTQLILSGSSMLVHGTARIDFSTTTRQIIDPAKPIRVSIALTSESNGMYVSNKSERGFDVTELNNGRSGNATFDWVAIVERRLDVTPQQVQQAVEEAQTGGTTQTTPPATNATPTSTVSSTTQTASTTEIGTTSTTASSTVPTTQPSTSTTAASSTPPTTPPAPVATSTPSTATTTPSAPPPTTVSSTPPAPEPAATSTPSETEEPPPPPPPATSSTTASST